MRGRKSPDIFSAMKKFSSSLKVVRRLHMCNKPIKKLADKKYGLSFGDMKPRGLWYGFNGSWADWCVSEEFTVGRYFYEVGVDASRILQIKNANQFDDFEEAYSCKPETYDILQGLIAATYFPSKWAKIDWERLKAEYAGLEINPYLYEKRLN